MPNALIKSFAKRTGKSIASLEKEWQAIKQSLLEQNPKDKNIYAKLVGILKKNHHIK